MKSSRRKCFAGGELWEFYSLVQLHCLCFLVRVEDVVSQLPTPAACCHHGLRPCGTWPKSNSALCRLCRAVSPQRQEGDQTVLVFIRSQKFYHCTTSLAFCCCCLCVCVCLLFVLAREKNVFFLSSFLMQCLFSFLLCYHFSFLNCERGTIK